MNAAPSDPERRPDEDDLPPVLAGYGLGVPRRVHRLESGHINESFRVDLETRTVLLQWINPRVFPRATAVQDNIERVLAYLDQRGAPPHPSLLAAVDGRTRLRTRAGLWRAFEWLAGYRTRTRPETPEDARRAGRALGAFLEATADLPVDALHEVLPGFHDLGVRLAGLDAVRDGDPERRAAAGTELDCIDAERSARLAAMPGGPLRVIHGDPKFTNILLPDPGSCRDAVLIDYDTLMPGRLAWDLGDFLRSAASAGEEDDPARAGVDEAALRAGAEGFASAPARAIDDVGTLAAAPAGMSFMLAVRFLTDHLEGDHYFRIRRPGQNLDRARTQLQLAAAFDRHRGLIASALGS